MLEKPDLPDEEIIACLCDEYGLNSVKLAFLPLGADVNTAVYRATTTDETSYFVKLRRGNFEETSVTLPRYFSDQGISQIIPPVTTHTQRLWADLDAFRLILYPYIEGHGGFEVNLADHHWVEFGAALKSVHSAKVPPAITSHIPQEIFSPKWREIVRSFQAQVENDTFDDPTAAKLATFMKSKRDEITFLVTRAERLATALQERSPEFVVCHSVIHAGNILIADHGAIYLVDWDNPILAPKERDLMFVGGGLGSGWHTPEQEATLFYQGYGQTHIDNIALVYYRYERIVQDIAAYCEQLLLSDEGGEDREEGLRQLTRQFLPNQVIDIARRSEQFLPLELQANPT
jgi:spectinomycin phosphotransferase